MKTPSELSFRQPAEWEPHESVWLAWPAARDLWQEELPAARASFEKLCRAIAAVDEAGRPHGERLDILVPDEAAESAAKARLSDLSPSFHRVPYGDIWLRDTAPIFVKHTIGEVAAVQFAFNGWGGKYVLDHDAEVAAAVAKRSGLRAFQFPWILEGGSVEVDGEGTVLTTRQCLLNRNRNPGMSLKSVEAGLREALGVSTVLWIDEGLLHDHTDGHIDTIARFVRPGAVVCMAAESSGDPNREVMASIASQLARMKDAKGRKLEVITIPSPGRVEDAQGRVMPASYVNFYIGNRAVVVPTYGVAADGPAVEAIAKLFPGRRTVGVPAKAILSGGGAFHCISQQQPA